jgi:2-oxoisovalerate dehydrogenase E1 component beta subunit
MLPIIASNLAIRRLASPDTPPVAFSEPLEAQYMLTPEKIADAIRELAAY